MTPEERDAAIAALFPIVRVIAHRVARVCRLSDADDLVGDGALGLVRAVDRFDPRRGVSLDQYARHIILGSILNGLRRKDPVSERARRRVREAERLRRELEAGGRCVTDAELEDAMPGFRRALAQVERGLPLSLDAPLPLGEKLEPDWSGDPARVYDAAVLAADVRGAIERLSPRHREIVLQHYFGERSLRAVSHGMSVTPQRISQLHCAAIARLRSMIGANVS